MAQAGRGRTVFAAGLAAAAIALAAGGVLFLGGAKRPQAGSALVIYFSGETMGELEPCDCSGEMAGGLPARAGCLKRAEGERLLLDVGCVSRGVRSWERLRGAAALHGMRIMGYDAMNLGETEVRLSRAELDELAGVGVPFVSANVRTDEGDPVAAPVLFVERAGLRAAVTGVVEAGRYPTGDGITIQPPREALAGLLPTLVREAGVVVLLADLELDDARALAREFPELTAILFRGRGDSHAPEIVNRTAVASVYGEARYLGRLDLKWTSPDRVTADGEAILLDTSFPEDAAVARGAIDWYKDRVRGRPFDLSEPGYGWSAIAHTKPPPDNHYVGHQTCAACHAEKADHWRTTAHARALESLAKRDYDWSPECVVCHVVGYGAEDGYTSREETPGLATVGCESCHGRGGLHARTQRAGTLRPVTEATCRRCHTPKRDPGWDMEVRRQTLKGASGEGCE